MKCIGKLGYNTLHGGEGVNAMITSIDYNAKLAMR